VGSFNCTSAARTGSVGARIAASKMAEGMLRARKYTPIKYAESILSGMVISKSNKGLFQAEKEKIVPIFRPAPIREIITIISEKYIKYRSFQRGFGHCSGMSIQKSKNPIRSNIIGKLILIFFETEGSQAIISVASPSAAIIK
jgi:hypothetical protein